MKIVVPYDIGIPVVYYQQLRELGAKVHEGTRPDQEELINRFKEAEIFVTNVSDRSSEIVSEAKNLKYLILLAAGYESINFKRMREVGVTVIICPMYSVQAVAEHALALFFAVARKIILANQSLRLGEWRVEDFEGTEIAGKSVGLIGYGNVGKKIEEMVSGFNTKINHVNSSSNDEELDKLISSSDIIFVCAAANTRTKQMLNSQKLNLMKPGTILINVSRGSIVDQAALYEILKTGKISAGLDVYQEEPSGGKMATTGPSKEILKLAELPNVVATPHIAFNTKEAMGRLGEEVLVNIKACLAGKPINIVEG